MPYGEFLVRLVLAALLGGAVGLEREVHGRSAGIRTYLILSLGTALLMVLSEYLLVAYHGKYPGLGLQGDPGRIAGQAITGVGFLGAGVIIRYKDTILGLTTAACVWLVCSVGLAVFCNNTVVKSQSNIQIEQGDRTLPSENCHARDCR